jgi:hypothetical protein
LVRNRHRAIGKRPAAFQETISPSPEPPSTLRSKDMCGETRPVGDYRDVSQSKLSCRGTEHDSPGSFERGSLHNDDPKTDLGLRSRPPPA